MGNFLNTVNSCLVGTPLLRTRTITDKIQIPGKRGSTGNDSQTKQRPKGVRFNESSLYLLDVQYAQNIKEFKLQNEVWQAVNINTLKEL